jgi:hypothetical protein
MKMSKNLFIKLRNSYAGTGNVVGVIAPANASIIVFTPPGNGICAAFTATVYFAEFDFS